MRVARITLLVAAGLNIVIGFFLLVLTYAGTATDPSGEAGLTLLAVLFASLLTLAMGVARPVIGLKFRGGGRHVRTAAIVFASLTGANSLLGLISRDGASGPSLALAAIVLSCRPKKETAAWLRRPR